MRVNRVGLGQCTAPASNFLRFRDMLRVLLQGGTPRAFLTARVVKLVDTGDLKSPGWKRLYRFDSGPGHHSILKAGLIIGGQRGLMAGIGIQGSMITRIDP